MDLQVSRKENGGWIRGIWDQYQARRTNEKELRQATEQVVQVADPVIRQARRYRKLLRTPVAGAMEYCKSLIDAIPGPVVLSRGRYHEDPLVKALFASPDELEEVLHISPQISALREQGFTGDVVALLTMQLQEKTIFGHQQVGDLLMRDVAQRAVSFSNHRIVAPDADLERTKAGIVNRGLEVLATVAMEEITTLRARKAELQEKREYLRAAVKILGGKNRSAEIFATPDPKKWEELRKAEKVLTEVEQELAELQKQITYPEQSLEHLEKIMSRPDDLLTVQNQTFRLNWMGVRVEDMPESEGDDITLAEFSLHEEFKRSAVMVSFVIGTTTTVAS
jgi:hypothetical protein